MHREPTHPGCFLEEDYLIPLGISHTNAATLLGIEEATFMLFLQKKVRCSKALAQKLEETFHVEALFWMNAQAKFDKWLRNTQIHDV